MSLKIEKKNAETLALEGRLDTLTAPKQPNWKKHIRRKAAKIHFTGNGSIITHAIFFLPTYRIKRRLSHKVYGAATNRLFRLG